MSTTRQAIRRRKQAKIKTKGRKLPIPATRKKGGK